jgi:hypothetical protein
MSGSRVLTPADGEESAYFGWSVSLSADGHTAIVGGRYDDVGVNGDQGSARVFVWNGSAWEQRGGALTPTDGATYDNFGAAVSLSADGLTAIVGGEGDDVGGNVDQGSARVFVWNGSAWEQRGGALTPTDGVAFDYFGSSVALSADGLTAIVGAPDMGGTDGQGSARVFVWNGSAWQQRGGALTPTEGAADGSFGWSVSLSADGLTAIVGGVGDDIGGNVDQGSARVFVWNGSAWEQRGGALTPTDGASGDYFGSSVSLSADGLTAIVGGRSDDVDWSFWWQGRLISGSNVDQGSARVFIWNGSAWEQRGGALTPTEGAVGGNFGWSVSLSADGLAAIVGGRHDDVDGNVDQGSARVFIWNGSAWEQRGGALTPTEGAAFDYFGSSVSLSADGLTAIVGVAGDDVGGNVDQGSARVFMWNGSAWIEGAPAPSSAVFIAATSASRAEGDTGATSYTFTATRTGDISTSQTATWAVTGSGANAAVAADFVGGVLPSGTVSFAAGETSWTITIDVAADSAVEPDEGFTITLSNPSAGLVLGTNTADGTILNDDVEPGPTQDGDVLAGTLDNDTLSGLGGNDSLVGLAGDDHLDGGADADTLSGDAGADSLYGNTGADSLDGGADADTLQGLDGDDTLAGGAGNDLFFINDTGDIVMELAGDGADTIITSVNMTMPDHMEALHIASGVSGITITGGAGNDVLVGNGLANTFIGGAGDDVILAGNVTLADIYALFAT